MSLPTNPVGLYWPYWSPVQRLVDFPSTYNVIFLFHAYPPDGEATGGDTGAVLLRKPTGSIGTNLNADIATCRARGQRIVVSVGGAGGQVYIQTQARANAFIQSIKDMNVGLGGSGTTAAFDGIDWNNFEQTALAGQPEWMTYAAQELKAYYGDFIFTSPPAAFSAFAGGQAESDRLLLATLYQGGVLDWACPQFYDPSDLNTLANVRSKLDYYNTAITVNGESVQIPRSVLGIGFGIAATATSSRWSPTGARDAYSTVVADGREPRGAFNWAAHEDTTSQFAAVVAPVITNYSSSPVVTLDTASGVTFSTDTPSLDFTGVDVESDSLLYEIEIRDSGLPALISSTSKTSGTANTVVTDGITTTGATFIVIGISFNNGTPPTITDSRSNTWTALTQSGVTSNTAARLYYCVNPTVGASHTFTASGTGIYTSIFVMAFDTLTDSNAFDAQNGGTSTGSSTVATGSITTAENGELIISIFAHNSTSSSNTISDSFTVVETEPFASGLNYGGSFAYLRQSSAGAINPTWTRIGTSTQAARIASFKTGIFVDTSDSSVDAGFSNLDTPADTHPFVSGDTVRYTVQTGLDNGTYSWKVRAKDPNGGGLFGEWSSSQEFTVNFGGDLVVSVSETISIVESSSGVIPVGVSVSEVITISEYSLGDRLLFVTAVISLSDNYKRGVKIT